MNISVVVPVWNRTELLARAVKSILSQEYLPKEIIIVDDGSDADIRDYIDMLVSKVRLDSQIDVCVIGIEHCGMAGKVRNIGVAQSRGDYIAFLDSDDEWLPTKLLLQKNTLEETKKVWCHTREIWIRDGKVKSQKSHHHKREGDIFSDSLVKCIVGPSTAVIKKKVFEEMNGFREDLEVAEDYELWLRICDKYEIAYVDEGLVRKFAGHGDQLSEKYDYIERFRIDALSQIIEKSQLSYNNKRLAIKEQSRKIQIWEQGARKRA